MPDHLVQRAFGVCRRFRTSLILPICFWLPLLFVCNLSRADEKSSQEKYKLGRAAYLKKCAECHGDHGQGVPEVNESPLHGDRSLKELIRVIEETMPEEEPQQCTGKEAERVAEYIYSKFYRAKSRLSQNESRIDLSRMTVRQHLQTAADLLAELTGRGQVDERRGLSGEYYKSRRFRGNDRVLKRIDNSIKFDFDKATPDENIDNPEEFSIRWNGSVLAEETGDYEFIIKTENGARLWVNDNRSTLIDAWVSSQGRQKEHKATIRLIGGRAYPLRLQMFKYKDPSASISLLWKPPRRAVEVIPRRNLSPRQVPETFITSAAFPPDDSVSGYERGSSVSKSWDQATTETAVEMAAFVVDGLDRFSKSKPETENHIKKVKQLCYRLAELAFRRPLTKEQKHFFVDLHFEEANSVAAAAKRSLLLIFKSPRFLYPSLGSNHSDDYTIASRLSYGLWDSLPDEKLLIAAAEGKLRTKEQISNHAERMLQDPRAKSKIRYFLHHWLQLNEKEGINKSDDLFPSFDEKIVSDLRTSLDMFLDEAIWNETSDYRRLLTADYIYLNDRLANFYGVELPDGDGFQKVSFKGYERAGVVTHPYMLSMLAYHNLSSPVHRGVFIVRRLLGRTLKPPPQATEFKDGDFKPEMTTREKIALLTKPTACQSCHIVINPLGFSLEHFDAVGRYREKEREKAIDAKAIYTTVEGEEVRIEGASDLARLIADSHQAQSAFIDQLFHQAVKQPINAYGPLAREELVKSFQDSEFNIRKALVEIMVVSSLYDLPER